MGTMVHATYLIFYLHKPYTISLKKINNESWKKIRFATYKQFPLPPGRSMLIIYFTYRKSAIGYKDHLSHGYDGRLSHVSLFEIRSHVANSVRNDFLFRFYCNILTCECQPLS